MSTFVLLAVAATLAPGQSPPPKSIPKKWDDEYSWTRVPSLKDIATVPASATHLILEGVGDEAALALQQRPDVRGVLFRDDHGTLTDNGIALLAKLPELRVLHLDGATALTPGGMRRIREMASLQELGLTKIVCDTATLKQVLLAPGLVALELRSVSGLDDDAFAAVAACARLRKLEIAGMPHIQKEAIERIAGLKALEILFLSDLDELSDEVIAKLEGLTELRWLLLDTEQVTSEGLRALAGLRKMRRLNISGSKFGSLAIMHVPVNVEHIVLAGCDGLDESVGETIRDRFPRLHRLSIDRAGWLTDEAVRSILQAPKLAELHLSLCDAVTGGGFAEVGKSVALKSISLEMCDGVSEADAAQMRKARPGLRVEVVD